MDESSGRGMFTRYERKWSVSFDFLVHRTVNDSREPNSLHGCTSASAKVKA